jgi:hypothetical protein
MARIITTEQQASSLSSRELPIESAADPVRSALAQPRAVLVLAGRDDEHSLIATIRTRDARRTDDLAGDRKVAAYEATGFLGLEDVAIYEEEQPRPWWKRLFHF